MPRWSVRLLPWIMLALVGGALSAQDEAPRARLEVEPTQAHVGDRLRATLTVELPAEMELAAREVGPNLGKFTVFSGQWQEPVAIERGRRFVWTGTISAFETGEFEVPPIRVEYSGPSGAASVSSPTFAIEILSVLEAENPEAQEVDLADLKPPASVDPDYRPLTIALIGLGALLVAAVVLWWLHRRYAARLAAVTPPDDPFHRMPPHEWVYQELRLLLERRIPEQGQVDLFYSELSRILKRYLGGRFRVDLMEHTTNEIAPLLEQVGAPERSVVAVARVLGECDRVKFARARPGADAWRGVVEAVYEIVDETKPVETSNETTERGAA